MAISADNIRVYVYGGGYVSFANDPAVEDQLNGLLNGDKDTFEGNDYYGDFIILRAENILFLSRRLAANASGRSSAGSLDAV